MLYKSCFEVPFAKEMVTAAGKQQNATTESIIPSLRLRTVATF
jgi:hypothetical protein